MQGFELKNNNFRIPFPDSETMRILNIKGTKPITVQPSGNGVRLDCEHCPEFWLELDVATLERMVKLARVIQE